MNQTVPSNQALRVIVFSKDRPLQLHATLSSLWARCQDQEVLDVRVLAYASSDDMARRYAQVSGELPFARLVPEQDFKETLLAMVHGARFLAFVCDDALFVRPWSAGSAVKMLLSVPKAIGVSLRLGENTTSCYTRGGLPQPVPPSLELIEGWRACDWPECLLDFGYPLELSSSIYRFDDVWPLLDALPYKTPNQLEDVLSQRALTLAASRPALIYPARSVAFCAPLNVVQSTHPNRHGGLASATPEALAQRFDEGLRVDVEALRGFTPAACHQEIDLPLKARAEVISAVTAPAAPSQSGPPAPPASAPPWVEGHLDWWKAGCKLPAPSELKASALLKVAQEHRLRVLVETGTYLGDTTAALLPHFDAVHTIELDQALHERAVRRFAGEPRVRCLQGDSAVRLSLVLAELGQPALFWLDAHYSGGVTARADRDTPVIAELQLILEHPVRGHVVLVDDARFFGLDPAYPSMRQVAELVERLRPDCTVDVALDIIRITPAARPAAAAPPPARGAAGGRLTLPSGPADPARTLEVLQASGAWRPGTPLRLHLGCGEQRQEGYVNLDLPPAPTSIMTTQADVFGDVAELRFPAGSVDELRSHHVFEHFPRVEALALLIRWHEWLKPGGRLLIETPDLEGSARTLLSDQPLAVKMAVVRHLAGDQAERWAFHVDHWFPARFRHTLGLLGFGDVRVEQSAWAHPPFLSNVLVLATKTATLTRDELLLHADALLAQSMVAPSEGPTLERWRGQLRARLAGGPAFRASAAVPETASVPAGPSPAAPPGAEAWLAARGSRVPLAEIVDFNQRARDRWIAERAAAIPAGARVLDVGAGTCPYRAAFAHCQYVTHDFKQYDGVKLGGGSAYGRIDLVSDVVSIPAPDASFDVVLCTEVLEHVPDPGRAVAEMVRLLRPGGRLLLTAPLGSGLHQLPFHYYGGFSPEWYRALGRRLGFEVVAITPNGGFFKFLAQETARAADLLSGAAPGSQVPREVLKMLGEVLPRWFFERDGQQFVDQFTVGYFVEARRGP